MSCGIKSLHVFSSRCQQPLAFAVWLVLSPGSCSARPSSLPRNTKYCILDRSCYGTYHFEQSNFLTFTSRHFNIRIYKKEASLRQMLKQQSLCWIWMNRVFRPSGLLQNSTNSQAFSVGANLLNPRLNSLETRWQMFSSFRSCTPCQSFFLDFSVLAPLCCRLYLRSKFMTEWTEPVSWIHREWELWKLKWTWYWEWLGILTV